MKIKSLLLSLLAVGLSLSSCNLDVEDSENYNTIPYSDICNLIVPTGEGNATAYSDSYVLTDYYYAGTVSVTSNDFTTGLVDGSFTTNAMNYSYVSTGNNSPSIIKFQGGHASGDGFSVTGLEGYVSQFRTMLPDSATVLKDYPIGMTPHALVMSYKVNDTYNVRTFPKDAVYGGTTSVMSGPMQTFNGNDTFYRIYFHKDLRQADIIVYGAKFAPQMPALTFVVKNLDVVFNKQGYTLQKPAGTEYLVPQVPEGNGGAQVLVPYPSRRISSLYFTPTSSDLTKAILTFDVQMVAAETVTATFSCEFNGAYCVSNIEE